MAYCTASDSHVKPLNQVLVFIIKESIVYNTHTHNHSFPVSDSFLYNGTRRHLNCSKTFGELYPDIHALDLNQSNCGAPLDFRIRIPSTLSHGLLTTRIVYVWAETAELPDRTKRGFRQG